MGSSTAGYFRTAMRHFFLFFGRHFFFFLFAATAVPVITQSTHQQIWREQHVQNAGVQSLAGRAAIFQIRLCRHPAHRTLCRAIIRQSKLQGEYQGNNGENF